MTYNLKDYEDFSVSQIEAEIERLDSEAAEYRALMQDLNRLRDHKLAHEKIAAMPPEERAALAQMIGQAGGIDSGEKHGRG